MYTYSYECRCTHFIPISNFKRQTESTSFEFDKVNIGVSLSTGTSSTTKRTTPNKSRNIWTPALSRELKPGEQVPLRKINQENYAQSTPFLNPIEWETREIMTWSVWTQHRKNKRILELDIPWQDRVWLDQSSSSGFILFFLQSSSAPRSLKIKYNLHSIHVVCSIKFDFVKKEEGWLEKVELISG